SILVTMKYISNEISLPMVAFGTDEAINVFSSDPQLKNRFKKVYLPAWEPNADFQRLLMSVVQLLPLKEPSGLSQEEMAYFIYSKTNGTIGEVNTLIRSSAILALKSGQEKITREVIESLNFESSKVEHV
ncbi:MAG: TniB family NTP-binding protein, partial [bacterium]